MENEYSRDTITVNNYGILADTTYLRYGGPHFAVSDSQNKIICLDERNYFKYDSNGHLKTEYIVFRRSPRTHYITKLNYKYSGNNLVVVQYEKEFGKDVSIIHRRIFYNESGNPVKETIIDLYFGARIEKTYNDSLLVLENIFTYNPNIKDTLYSEKRYYYNENKLLSRYEEFDSSRGHTQIKKYYYDVNNKLIFSRDSAIGEDNLYELSKFRKNLISEYFNQKKYEYDDRGNLKRIIQTLPDYITPIAFTEYIYSQKLNNKYFHPSLYPKWKFTNYRFW